VSDSVGGQGRNGQFKGIHCKSRLFKVLYKCILPWWFFLVLYYVICFEHPSSIPWLLKSLVPGEFWVFWDLWLFPSPIHHIEPQATAACSNSRTCRLALSAGSACGWWLDVNLSLLPHIFHKLFHSQLLNRTSLYIVGFNGNLKRQHISRKVKRANVSLDLGAAATATIIVLVVRSTHVTIQLFPNLVVGKGTIISMAQLVNGCTGIVENCGIPKRWCSYPSTLHMWGTNGQIVPLHLKITRVFICRLILNDVWFFLYDI